MSPEDEKTPRHARDAIFVGEDRELYLHVGYFITWFNMVELRITAIMAVVLGEKDLEAFNLLVKGMDAETKVIRLKDMRVKKRRGIGENLSRRLDFYRDKCGKLRNRIAHLPLIPGDEKREKFHHASLDRSTERALSMSPLTKLPPADHIGRLELFEKAYWMNFFSDDLGLVLDRCMTESVLEIESPRSPPLWADPSNPLG